MRVHVNTTQPNIVGSQNNLDRPHVYCSLESRHRTLQPSYARRRWKKIDTTGRGYIELHQLLDGSIVQGGTCPLQA